MFKGFFKKKALKEDAAIVVAPLSPAINDTISQFLGPNSLPPLPRTAHKAFSISTDPSTEISDFVEILEADEALSARVIKIANSVYFDRGTRSSTIEDAIHVIGINELRDLLNASTLSGLFYTRHPARIQLWSNNVATALTSRILAQIIIPEKKDALFLGGLVHDIGKLLLLKRNSEEYSTIMTEVISKNISFPEAEADRNVFTHVELGQYIGERWNFSPDVLFMIRHHHETWEFLDSSIELNLLAGIIKAADLISHSLGLGHPSNYGKFKNYCLDQLEEMWEYLNIKPEERKGILSEAKRLFEVEYDLYAQE